MRAFIHAVVNALVISLMVFALLEIAHLLTGCASLKELGAVNQRPADCHAKPGQIEFADIRTGYPFLSQAHRASCEVAKDGTVTWKNEEESGVDLSGDIFNEGFRAFTWGPKL